MKKRILIVEDDETIRSMLEGALTESGFECTGAGTLREARQALSDRPALILMDLGLPDGEGFTLCRENKKAQGPPLIILTARDDEADIIKGLDLGADDYVTKPFRLGILLSRINAVLRRASVASQKETILRCRDVELDQQRTLVMVGGEAVGFTAGEYRLLEIFLRNKNKTLTRTLLLEQLWDVDGQFVNDNTLTVSIKRIREKLGGDPQRIIQTVRGIGYKASEEDYGK